MGEKQKRPNRLLRRERELRGWSQRAIANMIDTTEQVVNRWESGEHKPNRYFQTQLCKIFGKNAEELGFMTALSSVIEDKEGTSFSPPSLRAGLPAVVVPVNLSLNDLFFPEGVSDLFTLGITALVLHQQQHQWDNNELERKVIQVLDEMVPDMQNAQQTSRREVLRLIAGMPLALSGFANTSGQRSSPLAPEDVIPLYAAGIPACWRLCYEEGGVQHVEQALPHYLAHLSSIARQPSQYQKFAARLASQGYKLANLLDLHHEDFGAALRHSKEALIYGQLAGDINLQLAALIEEALTFFYRKRFIQTLETYQQALQLLPRKSQAPGLHREISPIIEGRLYAGLAVAYAQVGQKQEALQYIGLAQETFPEHPEYDPHFAYTHYDHYYLYLYQGLMYMQLNQPEQALVSYAHFNLPKYNPRRAEIANKEAEAFLALGDMDQCCTTLETAVALALSKRSDLRYSQAHEVYQTMLITWSHEDKVKHLSQVFYH